MKKNVFSMYNQYGYTLAQTPPNLGIMEFLSLAYIILSSLWPIPKSSEKEIMRFHYMIIEVMPWYKSSCIGCHEDHNLLHPVFLSIYYRPPKRQSVICHGNFKWLCFFAELFCHLKTNRTNVKVISSSSNEMYFCFHKWCHWVLNNLKAVVD